MKLTAGLLTAGYNAVQAELVVSVGKQYPMYAVFSYSEYSSGQAEDALPTWVVALTHT